MQKYLEQCPKGQAKAIEFEMPDGRIPIPTHGCICGKGDLAERMSAVLTFANAVKAMGDSIIEGGTEQLYIAYSSPVEHNSVITKIG